jgi:hypothetical protein
VSRDQVLLWCGLIVAVGAALGVLWKFIHWIATRAKKLDTFLEDWNGTPARPGVCAVPGVMQRLDQQDVQIASLKWHVGNGNPVPLRSVVERNCTAIDDLLGIVGTRTGDKKRSPKLKGL